MSEESFKRRRPGALRIPDGEGAEPAVSLQMGDIIDVVARTQDLSQFPLSAPGHLSHMEFDESFRRVLMDDRPPPAKGSFSWSKEGSARGKSLTATLPTNSVPVNALVTPTGKNSGFQSSSPSSPGRGPRTLELASSLTTTPGESPRPSSESYREKATARRRLRALYRAHKLSRPSAVISGTDLATVSSLLADQEQRKEEQDAKTLQTIRNRENAAKARQNTKASMRNLKDQNDNLLDEVRDLRVQNKELRIKMEQLTMMLGRMQPSRSSGGF